MTLLALIATAYGVFGAASSLLEAARLLRSGRSDEISLGFLGVLLGGYLVWLLYGIATGDMPLIITDAVGLVCSTITLSIALRLRLRSGSWAAGLQWDGRSRTYR
jgi:MtN3 and saliva related transmembrane protein